MKVFVAAFALVAAMAALKASDSMGGEDGVQLCDWGCAEQCGNHND